MFIFKLMENVQFPGSKVYDTQMVIHYATSTAGVSLSW